jgi:environmental stress-induced protein Ves
MRNLKRALRFAATISLALTAVAFAADQKYRADGTIQRIGGDMVLVRTSAQDVEIKRDAKTKITGELRRGGAATVYYVKAGGENLATEIVMGGGAKPK